MADVYEQNLASKSTLTTTDYIRVVGSDNVSYKQLVSDVAKKIIENYTGSTLAGSAQSVKSAVDSLNSKTQAGYGAITDVTTTEKTQTITFANPYPYAPKVVVCLFRNGYNRRLHVSDITATNFTVTGALLSGSSSAAIEFQWIAYLA